MRLELLREEAGPFGQAVTGEAAQRLHHPFFKAGIATVLTLGATWGVVLLLRIGESASFTAIGIHTINAHGHAQVFGWIGLFVMGFALRMVPRFKETELAYPGLVPLTFLLMAGGLITRSLAQGMLSWTPAMRIAGLAGSIAEIVAIGLFLLNIVATVQRSEGGWSAADKYITAAIIFFFIQAVAGTFYFNATALAASRAGLLELVATWQAPLRDLQIHGFILLMILGVSQWVLPSAFGFRVGRRRLAHACLAVLIAGLGAESGGLVLMRLAGHAWAALWLGGVIAITGAVAALVWDWRVFGRTPARHRSLKFVRTAYGWLLVSLLMLLLLPVYLFGIVRIFAPASQAAELGFSHAYYGAVRHAITVGFASLMILGVSSWLIPKLNDLPADTLPGLWLPFALVNSGCALRVGLQVATDFRNGAFSLIAISGVLEVAGLALWGAYLWRLMNKPGPYEGAVTATMKETVQ